MCLLRLILILMSFLFFVNDHVRPMQGFIKLLKHDSEGTESLYPQGERDDSTICGS